MRRCACSGAVCADTPARRAMVLGRPVPRISTARISGVLPSRGGRATRVVVAVRDRRGRATLAAASPGLSRLSTSGLPRAHVSRHARRCRDRRSRSVAFARRFWSCTGRYIYIM